MKNLVSRIVGLSAVLAFGNIGNATENIAYKPTGTTSYVVSHYCRTGIPVQIYTPDIHMQHALTGLFSGALPAYQFLDFVSHNSADDMESAVTLLAKCMDVQFQKS